MVKLIAEIGCNHCGDLAEARAMGSLFAALGADVVKYQKRTVSPEVIGSRFDEPYDSVHSYGLTYGEHRAALELTIDQHAELKHVIEKSGAEYSCSVWDREAAEGICGLKPKHIKIPSARHRDLSLIKYVCEHAPQATVHISLGMSTYLSARIAIELVKGYKPASQAVYYTCTASYPCAPDQSHLEIPPEREGLQSGWSSHCLELHLACVAAGHGYRWIEYHVTMDRSHKGSDHKLSLEPAPFRILRNQLDDAEFALQARPREVLQCETVAMEKLQ